MKICHCLKMSTDEKVALAMVGRMLHQAAEDDMIAHDFNDGHNIKMDDIAAWFDDVIDYLEGWED